ncbi:diguanylate cyclase domain-containing protein [Paractinoplanes maris]|uniref:diguanylate cyclase domain-containing protein n=1 Tax=Paractinoplanes maris TaxID=1734446 RepID=UPI002021E7DB|nr:diguanylate cyclase [Actinoplanes maris]
MTSASPFAATTVTDGPRPPGYVVLGTLGQGHQGTVYRVQRDGAEFALKVLAAGAETGTSPAAARREAAKLATIRCPGVPRVYEVGSVEGRPYLVMEVVEGRPLSDALRPGPLPWDTLLRTAIGAATVLEAVHRAQLLHGDVKPDNIILGEDGVVRLIDFSLGAQLSAADADGRVAGSALYSSPEQSGMLERALDARADLYSLGAVLFEAATGKPPFTAPDLGQLLRQHALAPLPDLQQAAPHLPAAFTRILQRLLAKEPDDRHQSASDVLADLRLAAAEQGDPGDVPATEQRARDEVPLIGRDAELTALRDGWTQALAGRGGLVMVTGVSGVGKSHLVRELTHSLPTSSPVLHGVGVHGTKQPLAPLRAAIDGYLRELAQLPDSEAETAVQVLRTAAADTADMISHLSDGLSTALGTPASAGSAVDETRHTAAVASFLLELARRSNGLLLHLDDLQWYDRSTVRVLEQLAAEADRAPLLVVFTVRSEEADAEPVAAVREMLGDQLTTVTLPPLDVAATAALITTVNGGLAISDQLAARLAARSGGNPFILTEYVRALIDAGVVTVSWGEWRVDVAMLDGLTLPQDVSDLVRRRVDALDAANRHVLGTAATAGFRFQADVLAAVEGLSHRSVVTLLTDAARLGLVEELEEGVYGFLHERIREALTEQFDEVSRQRLHDRIADVLDRDTPSTDADVYALAHHRMSGTPGHDATATFAACRAAAELALTDWAPETAAVMLEHAAAVADENGMPTDDTFGELLATAYHRSARLDDAVAAVHAAVERATDPLRRAHLLRLLSMVHQSAWDTERQISAAEQALAELGRPLPHRSAGRALSSVGYFLLSVLIQLTGIGGSTRNPRTRDRYLLQCALYESLGAAYTRELQPAKSVIFALRAPYLTRRTGRSTEGVRAITAVALLLEFTGFPRLANRVSSRVAQDAAALGDQALMAHVAWSRAIARHGSGRDDGTQIRRMLDEHGRWLDFGLALDAYAVLSWDWLLCGDMATAETGLDQARRRATVSGQSRRSAVVAADACLLALRGRAGEAALKLNTIASGEIPLHQWVDLLIGRVQTAIERGDFGEDYERAMAEFDAYGLTPRDLLPAQHTFYCLRAYAELERCRTVPEQDRPAQLVAARAALATLGKVAYRPILRAYHRVGRAALCVLDGSPGKALERLTAAAADVRAVDAPLLEYEAARIQAHALAALQLPQHARRQANFAATVAHFQGWPHRVQRLMAEFGFATSAEDISVRSGAARYRDAQRQSALQQVSLAAARVLDPAQLVRIALDEVIRILGAERAFLLLEDDSTAGLGSHVGRDAYSQDLVQAHGYSTRIVDQVRAGRRAVVVTGTDRGELPRSDSMIEYDLRSIVAAPIVLDDRLLGVVYLDSRLAKGVFTGADLELLTAVGHQIAISLETARAAQLEVAVATAQHQRDLAELLRKAMTSFAGTLDPEDVLDRLMVAVRQTGATDHFGLITAAEDAAALTVRYHDGDETRRRLVEGMPEEFSALLRYAHPTPPQHGPAASGLARVGAALADCGVTSHDSWRLIPLTVRDGQLGILLLGSAAPAGSTADPQVIATLAGQAMTAYENARLFAQVHHMAAVDSLTGIANRRSFFDRAQQEFASAGERHRGAVLMIDVDNFKKINDGHGHHIGDEVLRGVAARLQASCGTTDLVARYGGEEFVVLLPDGGEQASAVAERIRCEVAGTPIATSAGPVPVTVSVGATPTVGVTAVDAALTRADSCLYEAKHGGRNRVVVAEAGAGAGPSSVSTAEANSDGHGPRSARLGRTALPAGGGVPS